MNDAAPRSTATRLAITAGRDFDYMLGVLGMSIVGFVVWVTERAVEKHISNIFWKLDLPATSKDHRRVLAVLAWLQPQ